MKIINISDANELINNKSEIENKLNKKFDYKKFIDSYININNTIYIENLNILPFSVKKIDNENIYLYITSKSSIADNLIKILENINYDLSKLHKSDINEITLKTTIGKLNHYFLINNMFYF